MCHQHHVAHWQQQLDPKARSQPSGDIQPNHAVMTRLHNQAYAHAPDATMWRVDRSSESMITINRTPELAILLLSSRYVAFPQFEAISFEGTSRKALIWVATHDFLRKNLIWQRLVFFSWKNLKLWLGIFVSEQINFKSTYQPPVVW